eukprot:jgi/Chrzof1/1454/Cz10g08160.t1
MSWYRESGLLEQLEDTVAVDDYALTVFVNSNLVVANGVTSATAAVQSNLSVYGDVALYGPGVYKTIAAANDVRAPPPNALPPAGSLWVHESDHYWATVYGSNTAWWASNAARSTALDLTAYSNAITPVVVSTALELTAYSNALTPLVVSTALDLAAYSNAFTPVIVDTSCNLAAFSNLYAPKVDATSDALYQYYGPAAVWGSNEAAAGQVAWGRITGAPAFTSDSNGFNGLAIAGCVLGGAGLLIGGRQLYNGAGQLVADLVRQPASDLGYTFWDYLYDGTLGQFRGASARFQNYVRIGDNSATLCNEGLFLSDTAGNNACSYTSNGVTFAASNFALGTDSSNQVLVAGLLSASNLAEGGLRLTAKYALSNHDAAAITTGTLTVPRGGTGASNLAANKLLVGSGSNALLQPTALHCDAVNGRLGVGTSAPAYSLDVAGTLQAVGGSKLVVQNSQDGGPGRGLFLWTANDPNWGIYMGQPGAGRSLSGGTACAGAQFSTHALRLRLHNTSGNGLIYENSCEQCMFSVRANDGLSYLAGTLGLGTTTPNTSFKLDVIGSITVSSVVNAAQVQATNHIVYASSTWDHLWMHHNGTTGFIDAGGAENGLQLRVGNTNNGGVNQQTYMTVLTLQANGSAAVAGVISEGGVLLSSKYASASNVQSSLSNYYTMTASDARFAPSNGTVPWSRVVGAPDFGAADSNGGFSALAISAVALGSAAALGGLAVNGRDLFDGAGNLVSSLTKPGGRMLLDYAGELINMRYGRFEDGLRVGLQSITLSNNRISITDASSNEVCALASNALTWSKADANYFVLGSNAATFSNGCLGVGLSNPAFGLDVRSTANAATLYESGLSLASKYASSNLIAPLQAATSYSSNQWPLYSTTAASATLYAASNLIAPLQASTVWSSNQLATLTPAAATTSIAGWTTASSVVYTSCNLGVGTSSPSFLVDVRNSNAALNTATLRVLESDLNRQLLFRQGALTLSSTDAATTPSLVLQNARTNTGFSNNRVTMELRTTTSAEAAVQVAAISDSNFSGHLVVSTRSQGAAIGNNVLNERLRIASTGGVTVQGAISGTSTVTAGTSFLIGSTDSSRKISCLNPSLGNGQSEWIALGRAAANYQEAQVQYCYNSADVAQSYMGLGLFGLNVTKLNGYGGVGIGTSAPTAVGLTVAGTTSVDTLNANSMTVSTALNISGTNYILFGAGYNPRQVDAGKMGYRLFSTALDIVGASSGTPRDVRIWDRLILGGGNNVNGVVQIICTANDTRQDAMAIRAAVDGNYIIHFISAAGATRGAIQGTSSGVNYMTVSDKRLKKKIQPLRSMTDAMKRLKPVEFQWVADSAPGIGFLAQDVYDVIPEMRPDLTSYCGPNYDVENPIDSVTGKPVHLGVDYGKLTPFLCKGLQETIARVEALEADLAALKAAGAKR